MDSGGRRRGYVSGRGRRCGLDEGAVGEEH